MDLFDDMNLFKLIVHMSERFFQRSTEEVKIGTDCANEAYKKFWIFGLKEICSCSLPFRLHSLRIYNEHG
jgi:hypothetical protein